MRLLVAIMVVAACAQPPASQDEVSPTVSETEALVGPYWRLVELSQRPSIPGGGAREPHLRFTPENRVSGATGCNTLGGRYERTGEGLRFSELFSTKMACLENARMYQEGRFMSVLRDTDRFAVTGDTLILFAGETVVARFVRGEEE